MNTNTTDHSPADDALLLGLLALEAGLVERAALLRVLKLWVRQRDQPLDALLAEHSLVSPRQQVLLQSLAEEHRACHGGDRRRCLAAFHGLADLREDLEALADPDLHTTLSGLPLSVPASVGDTAATRQPPASDRDADRPRFRILRPLASGGLGQVHVARDEDLQREVALKEILDRHADDAHSQARFLREAEITGRLEHPGIVPVYALGRHFDGRPYYAMRLVQGETLQDALQSYHQQGRPPAVLRQLLRRFIDVCNAVAYAHSKGVIHRDLKPNNVLLGEFGETQLVDWGLARRLTPDDASARPREDEGEEDQPGKTQAGQVMGTPGYMSPEQAAGRADLVSPASDVYSLGATLYAILAGRPPAEGRDVGEVLARVRRGEVPPLGRQAPPALESVCRRAMALHPADRYPTASALGEEVEHWLADEAVRAHHEGMVERLARWSRRHRAWTAAVAAALVLTAGVAVAAALLIDSSRRAEGRERERAELLADSLGLEKDATEQQRQESVLRLADNYFSRGLELCQRHETSLGLHWMVRALESIPGRDVPGAADLEHLVRRNLSAWEQGLKVWPPLESPRAIVAAGFGAGPHTLLTADELGTVRVYDLRRGDLLRSIGPGAPDPHTGRGLARFSPDGRTVLLCRTIPPDGTGPREFTLYDAASGNQLEGKTVRIDDSVDEATFAPDGTLIGLCGSRCVHLWRLADNRVERLDHPMPPRRLAFSAGGKLAVGCRDGSIHLWDLPTSKRLATSFKIGLGTFGTGFCALKLVGEDRLLAATDMTAHVWDLKDGKEKALAFFGAGVTCADLAPRGDRMFAGGMDRTVQVWNTYNGKLVYTLRHLAAPTAVAVSNDGTVALTASVDGVARFWDVSTGEQIGPPMQQRGSPRAVAFDAGGGRAVVAGGASNARPAGRFGEVALVQQFESLAPSPELLPRPPGGRLEHVAQHLAVAPSPLAVAVRRGQAVVWENGSIRQLTLEDAPEVSDVAVSADGRFLATVHTDFARVHEVRLWDWKTGRAVGLPLVHPAKVTALAFHPRDPVLATGCADGTIRFWDAATGQARALHLQREGFAVEVSRLRFADSGRVLAGDVDGTRFWTFPEGKPLVPPARSKELQSIGVLSADGRAYLSPDDQGGAHLYLLPESPGDVALARVALAHPGPVGALAFSADGLTMMTGGVDRLVRLWDRAGRSVGRALPHPDRVSVVAFSPDGQTLLTYCEDRKVRLWDRTTGRPIGAPFWEGMFLGSSSPPPRFAPDGGAVFAFPYDRRVRVRAVPRPCGGTAAQVRSRVEWRTARALDAQEHLRTLTPDEWRLRYKDAGPGETP